MTCNWEGCSREALKNDTHCREHHIELKEREWLDNSDPDNLGITKWIHEMMPEFAFSKSAKYHKTMLLELLSLYDPGLKNKYERLRAFVAFRESAKSTLANTLFVSYIIAHNNKSFKFKVDGKIKNYLINEKTIVIISETAMGAEDFTSRIRDAFSTSPRLKWYYQFSIQEAIDSLTGQWTRSAFQINGLYVLGVGTGQMIRGKVKGQYRPTLVIPDDIYSENNTITEERRLRVKRWWNNAVMNSIDSLLGKVVMLGTILHEDTVLAQVEYNPMWKVIKIPVMGKVTTDNRVVMDRFHEFLDTYIRYDRNSNTCVLPFDEVHDTVKRRQKQQEFFAKVQAEKDWELQWPERIDLYLLALKFKEAVYSDSIDGFYQEYFHQILPPYKRFTTNMFMHIEHYEFEHNIGLNWLYVFGAWHHVDIVFGVDLAAGKGRDKAVITVLAVLPDGRCVILLQREGAYWGLRDEVHQKWGQSAALDLRLNKVVTDRDSLSRVGLIDEIVRLAIVYHPSTIKVGVAGEESLIVQGLGTLLRENRLYTIHVMARPQTSQEGKKEQRIQNTLLPYYETRMVYHAGLLQALEHQLEFLGKTAHDDHADSAECAFFALTFPEPLEKELYVKTYTPSSTPKFKNYVTRTWKTLF